jgi:hypothetical protein
MRADLRVGYAAAAPTVLAAGPGAERPARRPGRLAAAA